MTTGLALETLLLTRPLDAIPIGEEPVQRLEMPVEGIKRGTIVFAALVTGTFVTVSRTTGFVGLTNPDAVRLVTGVPHRRVVSLRSLAGATVLCWADLC